MHKIKKIWKKGPHYIIHAWLLWIKLAAWRIRLHEKAACLHCISLLWLVRSPWVIIHILLEWLSNFGLHAHYAFSFNRPHGKLRDEIQEKILRRNYKTIPSYWLTRIIRLKKSLLWLVDQTFFSSFTFHWFSKFYPLYWNRINAFFFWIKK